MDMSIGHLTSLSYHGNREGRCLEPSHGFYSAFTAPTPSNKAHIGNTLTPGAIPSPLNFPSITPPSSPFSPYSLYGIYSPTAGAGPLYDPGYLRRLKNNPMFKDLQSLLLQECLQMQVPANLITTSWNLMQLHKPTISTNQKPACSMAPPTSTNQNTGCSQNAQQTGSGQQVYMQHMKLQDKLLKVRIDPAVSADGLSVENEYSKEVGDTEMERYRALNSCPDDEVKTTINSYYDRQRLKLIKSTEDKLDQLINKAEMMRLEVTKNRKCQMTVSEMIPKVLEKKSDNGGSVAPPAQGASLLLQPMDDKDKLNAVRKLKFNSEDNEQDDDYLNCSVNSEDFEINDIDVETVDNTSEQTKDEDRQTTTEPDLLKQCIAASGLDKLGSLLPSDDMAIPTTARGRNNSTGAQSEGSCSSSNSPISMASAADLTNQNLSTDNSVSFNEDQVPSPRHCEENLKLAPTIMSLGFGSHMFSTPSHGSALSFTNPANLNYAMAEIQKLCGGAPSLSFTPEYRRDIIYPAFTPDTVKSSPLNEISNMPGMLANPSRHQTTNWNAYHNHRQSSSNLINTTRTSSPHESTDSNTKGVHHANINVCDSTNNNVQLNIKKPQSTSAVSSSETTSTSNKIRQDDFQFENTPMFRTHRMLTPEATEILLSWYNSHVQYPYPNETEVAELVKVTGITARQVKKWMANRRVRCFNTLSITGNEHPIKFKYQGKGRKRKEPMPEKENCDSTTTDSMRPNYTVLTEEAKQVLNDWYEEHLNNPYPSEDEKQQLANQCAISVSQVKSWFANKRNRTNNTKRQIPNYFIEKFPEYTHLVNLVGQKREEERQLKRRKTNEVMFIQPPFYF